MGGDDFGGGLWVVVVINSVIFIAFAFSFFRSRGGRDWRAMRDDPGGVETFRSFATGRRILAMYEEMAGRGETGVCFLRITPDATLSTYMVGHSTRELTRRMESGIERVRVP